MVWMNERRQVKTAQVLDKARDSLVKNVDPEAVDDANDLNLVHTSGTIVIPEPCKDERFGICLDQVVKIKRSVQVYQWAETVTPVTGDSAVEYSHSTGWHGTQLDSSKFTGFDDQGEPNPQSWPVEPNTFTADQAKLGQYQLSEGQISRLTNFQKWTPSEEEQQAIIEASSESLSSQGYTSLTWQGDAFVAKMQKNEGESAVKVGDIRITFDICRAENITVMA